MTIKDQLQLLARSSTPYELMAELVTMMLQHGIDTVRMASMQANIQATAVALAAKLAGQVMQDAAAKEMQLALKKPCDCNSKGKRKDNCCPPSDPCQPIGQPWLEFDPPTNSEGTGRGPRECGTADHTCYGTNPWGYRPVLFETVWTAGASTPHRIFEDQANRFAAYVLGVEIDPPRAGQWDPANVTISNWQTDAPVDLLYLRPERRTGFTGGFQNSVDPEQVERPVSLYVRGGYGDNTESAYRPILEPNGAMPELVRFIDIGTYEVIYDVNSAEAVDVTAGTTLHMYYVPYMDAGSKTIIDPRR